MRGKYCWNNSPDGHLRNFIARFFAERNSPESQICNSVGPCSRHFENYIFQKVIQIRDGSAKNV